MSVAAAPWSRTVVCPRTPQRAPPRRAAATPACISARGAGWGLNAGCCFVAPRLLRPRWPPAPTCVVLQPQRLCVCAARLAACVWRCRDCTASSAPTASLCVGRPCRIARFSLDCLLVTMRIANLINSIALMISCVFAFSIIKGSVTRFFLSIYIGCVPAPPRLTVVTACLVCAHLQSVVG